MKSVRRKINNAVYEDLNDYGNVGMHCASFPKIYNADQLVDDDQELMDLIVDTDTTSVIGGHLAMEIERERTLKEVGEWLEETWNHGKSTISKKDIESLKKGLMP